MTDKPENQFDLAYWDREHLRQTNDLAESIMQRIERLEKMVWNLHIDSEIKNNRIPIAEPEE